MEKLILIKPSDVMRLVDFDSEADDHLDFYYKYLDCDMIDIVRPHMMRNKLKMCKDLILIVDDEGLLKENPKPNALASIAYGDVICGNVLIAKEQARDDGIYTVGLNMRDVKEFEKALSTLMYAIIG